MDMDTDSPTDLVATPAPAADTAPVVTDEPPAPRRIETGRRAIARLIEYRPNCRIALPPHCTVEVVENPHIVPVPASAPYALGLMAWQGDWLPLIDLAGILPGPATTQAGTLPHYALVVSYQPAPQQPALHGALALRVLPEFTAVTDAQQCAYPDAHPRWAELSLSCFLHDGQPVPILDSNRLFAAYHAPLMAGQGRA